MKLMKTIMLGLHVSILCFSSRNQLQELPSCIGRLSSLVSLHAEHNKLTQLCIEVVDCRKLEELVSLNQLLIAKSLRNWWVQISCSTCWLQKTWGTGEFKSVSGRKLEELVS